MQHAKGHIHRTRGRPQNPTWSGSSGWPRCKLIAADLFSNTGNSTYDQHNPACHRCSSATPNAERAHCAHPPTHLLLLPCRGLSSHLSGACPANALPRPGIASIGTIALSMHSPANQNSARCTHRAKDNKLRSLQPSPGQQTVANTIAAQSHAILLLAQQHK